MTRERTYNFLAGLNRSLDDIRSRILSVKPLPLINEIFAKVHREENRKHVMLGPLSSLLKASTLAARQSDGRNKQRNSPFCEHYQKPYHTKATCWKLHGKPADWVPHHLHGSNGKGLQIVTKTSTEPALASPFLQAQLDHLNKLFFGSSTLLMAHGIAISSLTSQPPKGDPWIINSGASDHMTGTRSLFRDYFPYHGDCCVKLADGSFTVLSDMALFGSMIFFVSPVFFMCQVCLATCYLSIK